MQNQYPEIFIQFLSSIILAILLVGTIVSIVLIYQKKKIKQKEELINLKLRHEKELIQTQLDIQEELLSNVSMEIHDNVGQVMMLAKVNTTLLQKLPLDQEGEEIVQETKLLITQALEDLTELSRAMHSDRILQMGAIKAIYKEFEMMAKKGLFEFEYISDLDINSPFNLSKQSQLTIYRTFQEISKNIIKHSKATRVTLDLRFINETIIIEIQDNGIGVNKINASAYQEPTNGMGINSMQKRILSINGKFEIHSETERGTQIRLIIPIPV